MSIQFHSDDAEYIFELVETKYILINPSDGDYNVDRIIPNTIEIFDNKYIRNVNQNKYSIEINYECKTTSAYIVHQLILNHLQHRVGRVVLNLLFDAISIVTQIGDKRDDYVPIQLERNQIDADIVGTLAEILMITPENQELFIIDAINTEEHIFDVEPRVVLQLDYKNVGLKFSTNTDHVVKRIGVSKIRVFPEVSDRQCVLVFNNFNSNSFLSDILRNTKHRSRNFRYST